MLTGEGRGLGRWSREKNARGRGAALAAHLPCRSLGVWQWWGYDQDAPVSARQGLQVGANRQMRHSTPLLPSNQLACKVA